MSILPPPPPPKSNSWNVTSLKNIKLDLDDRDGFQITSIYAQGAFIATGNTEGVLKIFDFEGDLLHEFNSKEKHKDSISGIILHDDIAVSFSKSIGVFSGIKGELKIWCLEKGKLLKTKEFNGGIKSVCINDDKIIVASDGDNAHKLSVLDKTGSNVKTLKVNDDSYPQPRALTSFNNNLYYNLRKEVICYDVDKSTIIDKFSVNESTIENLNITESKIVYGGSGGIYILDKSSKETIKIAPDYSDYDPFRMYVFESKIFCIEKKNVNIYDINTGKLIHSINAFNYDVSCMCVGNKQLFATCDEEIKVWG